MTRLQVRGSLGGELEQVDQCISSGFLGMGLGGEVILNEVDYRYGPRY